MTEFTSIPPATDLLLMRLRDDLREGGDLGPYVPMLMARIEADRAEIAKENARSLALAEDCDRLTSEVMQERDDNAEMADNLARAISVMTGVEIGERSNMNDPWQNALKAAAAVTGR